MLDKPVAIFNRTHEWEDLVRFATSDSPGVRIGVVRGRRRHGKSFLLEHLCEAARGIYTVALRQTKSMAINRFTDSISQALGYRLGTFSDWESVLDATIDLLTRETADGRIPLLVLDEFPYLISHSPELPSIIQTLYDKRGPARGHPPFKIILCGSAVAFMSTLLAGNQALRGRAILDMRIGPFHYRDAAEYWACDPDTAFLIDATVGGSPGYRDVIDATPEPNSDGFYYWLSRSLLNPSHILFTEPDYLLAEDPRIGERTVYHAIWQAVSQGATTPTQIGGLVGIEAKSLSYYLNIMKDGGFLHYGQDLLLQRKPIITIADPAVRFHNLIVRPNLAQLERRDSRTVWERSRDTFSAKILGPHFEELAREWVKWHGEEAGLDNLGDIGSTVMPCREHRGHEIDVIALDRDSLPRNRNARIALLGEAKATTAPRTISDVDRLIHIREMLGSQGWHAKDAKLAIFSHHGFTPELTSAAGQGNVILLDLPALYGERRPIMSQ